MKPTKDYLREVPLFSDFDDASLEKLASFSIVKKYSKDAVLFYEQELSKDLLFLKSGLLKFYRIDKFGNEVFLYYVYPNNIISEIFDFDTEEIHCYSNAEFVEESEVLTINYAELNKYFLKDNIFTVKILKELSKKIKELQCILRREMEFDGTSKVAHMIVNDFVMFKKLKKQEIAYMLHIQPETLSRILKKLVKNGYITDSKTQLEILDEEGLKSIYTEGHI